MINYKGNNYQDHYQLAEALYTDIKNGVAEDLETERIMYDSYDNTIRVKIGVSDLEPEILEEYNIDPDADNAEEEYIIKTANDYLINELEGFNNMNINNIFINKINGNILTVDGSPAEVYLQVS